MEVRLYSVLYNSRSTFRITLPSLRSMIRPNRKNSDHSNNKQLFPVEMSVVPHSMVLNRWIISLSLTCDDHEPWFDYVDSANRITFDVICKLTAIGHFKVRSINPSSFYVFKYQKLSCLNCSLRPKFSFNEGRKGSFPTPRVSRTRSLHPAFLTIQFAKRIQKQYKSQAFTFTSFSVRDFLIPP